MNQRQKQERRHKRKAIRKLKEQGLSPTRIAQRTNTDKKTVKRQIRRGKA